MAAIRIGLVRRQKNMANSNSFALFRIKNHDIIRGLTVKEADHQFNVLISLQLVKYSNSITKDRRRETCPKFQVSFTLNSGKIWLRKWFLKGIIQPNQFWKKNNNPKLSHIQEREDDNFIVTLIHWQVNCFKIISS